VLTRLADRRVIVATIDEASPAAMNRARDAGAEVLPLGSGSVDGRRLVAALVERQIRLIYSTAGPAVLHMLLSSGVLQRLYLTTVLRILAGDAYATLARGAQLDPPYDFELAALYLDRHGPDGVPQCMQVYDRRRLT
jgi:riboflavin biosynthesis pyrimidine reductase